ncbi:adenylosuccinate synthetase, partial [Candidatus Woesearchaeota archaeon]|nr:adenylosuccinate synthetase [Candidatus Woesearchaeota archaeon]
MNDYNDLVKIVESSGFLNVIGDSQIASVQCLQFGDTGKGKIVALLALWADFTARGTGTSNAGHTSYIKYLDQL